MTDEVLENQNIGLSSLDKSDTGSYLLPKDTVVSLPAEDYQKEFKVTNQNDFKETHPAFKDRKIIELSGDTDEPGQNNVNIGIAVGVEDSDRFLITNEHSEAPLTVWIYGEKMLVMPGESVSVPSKKPAEYAEIKGIEDGVFYVSTGENEAMKVSKNDLSPDLKIKHFSINEVTPPPTDESTAENIGSDEYSKAKQDAVKELGLQRKQIERDTAAYREDLTKPWATRENPTTLALNMKKEMQQYVLENEAALRWLDAPSDDPEIRKLVAKRLERSAFDLLHISGYMISNKGENNFGDPTILEDNKKRADAILKLSKVIGSYSPLQ